jgi:hypothetical protein
LLIRSRGRGRGSALTTTNFFGSAFSLAIRSKSLTAVCAASRRASRNGATVAGEIEPINAALDAHLDAGNHHLRIGAPRQTVCRRATRREPRAEEQIEGEMRRAMAASASSPIVLNVAGLQQRRKLCVTRHRRH